MLKKIENISSSAEMKSNAHFSANLGAITSIQNGKNSFSDSLSFSTAFKFLSQLKWQLKSFKRTENDEVIIEFTADGFDFSTSVSLYEYQALNIIYKVVSRKLFGFDKSLYELKISFDFDSRVYSGNSIEDSFKHIKLLFEKVSSYSGLLFDSINDPETNSLLLGEYEEGLIYEFSMVHKNVIHFIEKVIGEVINKNFMISSSSENNKRKIKILQINVKA